ncbi:peptidase S24/S26A/S26B/S26C [Lophiotrema nucula]|uniref:Mitochondrial inner membrane protease subunit n=1 Tax=Lophiotrema nucula TaxID=690887 RepID=A0A6A5ZVY1_9PLEO|nr:peptidase S24/S26A/S26B/S26C [Lophiotrema nucula]
MPPPRIYLASIFARLRNLRSNIPPRLSRNHLKSAAPGGVERNAARYMLTVAQVYLGFHLTFKYFYKLEFTSGISMVPTIPHGINSSPPCILVSMLHRRGKGVKVGDVVVYTHPSNQTQACKRVIGMPGDYVCVVSPNREAEDLPTAAEEEEEDTFVQFKEEMIRVPEGHCWVAGDNLEWSRDSRIHGAVPLNLIRGKVLAVCLPFGERKWLGGGGLREVQEGGHELVIR